ncbi:MAG: High-affinity nickel-transporter [Actinobacteria bacterium]|nr:High-affinity nickel-transporter [Actinomycetota bacterium]
MVLGAVAATAAPAAAHPLGNFTSNVYAGLRVTPERVLIDHVVDLAEIPALQARQDMGARGGGPVAPEAAADYRRDECARVAEAITVRLDGEAHAVTVTGSRLTLPPGQAGLATLRLECDLVVRVPAIRGTARVRFRNRYLDARIGWREVTAVGDGTTLVASTAPVDSVSRRLTAYPQGRLGAPPDRRGATLTVSPGGDTVTPGARGRPGVTGLGPVDAWTDEYTALIARQDLTPAFALLAAVLAIALGALHAAAPGHGKTVMAAYLVGRQGSARQAAALGLTVAVTHTAGVLALGALLSATQAVAPERLYPWLGLASGLLFASIGAGLLRRSLRQRHAHRRHGHPHAHATPPAPTWRTLAVPGLAGGMVPSPSALVVLLGGIALGRAWYGVALVLAYGLGMAATLVGAGYLLLRARAGLERRTAGQAWPRLSAIWAALPMVTAGLIVVGGVVIALRAVLPV